MSATLRSFIYTLSLCFSFMLPCNVYGMAGLPNMSPAEMENLEQELERAAQEIEQYVNSLSPEEQEEFHKAVNEVEQMINNMSEEEKGQFFEEVLSNELTASEESFSPINTPVIKPKPQKELPIIAPPTDKQEAALRLLESLIQVTDVFITKTQNIPDIKQRVSRWIKDGKITSSDSNTTWENIKQEINIIRQSFDTLKQIDEQTKKHRFIDILIEKTSLYQTLEQLEKNLSLYEPRIIVASFGIEKLSSQSKLAIKEVINAYTTILKTATTEILDILKEYEPEAKKIREEEKKVTERAKAEAARPRRPSPARIGGKSESFDQDRRYRSGGQYDYPDYGHYGGGSDYGPSYRRPDIKPTEAPKTEKPPKAPKDSGIGKITDVAQEALEEVQKIKSKIEKAQTITQKQTDQFAQKLNAIKNLDDSGKLVRQQVLELLKQKRKESEAIEKGTTPEERAKIKEDIEKAKKEEVKKKEKKLKKKRDVCYIESDNPDTILKLINNTLELINELIQETKALNNLEQTVFKKGTVDIQFALVTLPGIEGRVKRLHNLIKQFIQMTNNDKKQINELQIILANSLLFKKLSPQLYTLIEQLKDDMFIQKIPADNRYAYFGKDKLKLKSETVKLKAPTLDITKKVKNPANFKDIAEHLANISELLQLSPSIPSPKKDTVKEPKKASQIPELGRTTTTEVEGKVFSMPEE